MVDSRPDNIGEPLADDSDLVKQSAVVHLAAAKNQSRREKADGIIKSNVIQAVMMGLIPVPVLDVLALTNIQFKMMDDLVRLYGIRYTKIERSIVKSFVLGMLPVATITGLSSMLKLMPGIGSFIGSAGVSVSAGGLTYATGKVFARHFETGGTLDDFNLEEAKRQFRQELRRGREVARELTERKHLPPPENNRTG